MEQVQVNNTRRKNSNIFKNQRVTRGIIDVFIYLLLIVLCLIWIFPIVWLIANSFREAGFGKTGLSRQLFLPEFSFDNYIALFNTPSQPYVQWFTNTLIVAIFTSLISTTVVLLTSFSFSRLRFKGRKTMMKVLMVLGMFPGFMAMIAIYYILKAFGLLPNQANPEVPVYYYLISLILVGTSGSAMGYLVSKGYFDTISHAIDESAQIDGANKAQIFWHITLPLSKPIVIYTALTSFMGPWGDYIFVNTITRGETKAWTVALGLYKMINSGQEKLGLYFTMFCAGAVLISIPIVILFTIMQKYYVSGIAGGAVKG